MEVAQDGDDKSAATADFPDAVGPAIIITKGLYWSSIVSLDDECKNGTTFNECLETNRLGVEKTCKCRNNCFDRTKC